MSDDRYDVPAAVGFGLEASEDEESILTEKDKEEKRRFQQAMLAQKLKRQNGSSQKRSLLSEPLAKVKVKGEYFRLPTLPTSDSNQ